MFVISNVQSLVPVPVTTYVPTGRFSKEFVPALKVPKAGAIVYVSGLIPFGVSVKVIVPSAEPLQVTSA